MIQDKETNIVYLSYKLCYWKEFKNFYNKLIGLLDELHIKYAIIYDSKDIWIRDYMPIQLGDNDFIKYKYAPDYLVKIKGRETYITDCTEACRKLGILYHETEIIIDGGNIVSCGENIIMTDKVFTENNKPIGDITFHKQLEEIFRHKVIFIPWHPTGELTDDTADVFGHADGFIKYCGENRILMGNHREFNEEEAIQIRKILENNGYKLTEMLFPVSNPNLNYNWAYINFLQVGDKIIMPKFGIDEDEYAQKYIQSAFPYCEIRQIDCKDIALKGGALHCITWNIKTNNINYGT